MPLKIISIGEVSTMIAKEKIAAVACGDKMFRVCYLIDNIKSDHNIWFPIWNAKTYDTFDEADNAAKEYCQQHHHNVISEYVSLR